MATGSNEVDEIYHRMAVIRRELHTNVRESVAGAEAVVDWGKYTWTYPWVALGAAAAAGYLVYVGSRQKVTANVASLAGGSVAGEPTAGAEIRNPGRPGPVRNLLFIAWDMLFPVAVRAGQNHALHWLEQQYPTGPSDRSGLSSSAGERGGW